MEYTAFNLAAWNPLHSIGMLLAMLHKIHCIQSRCIGPRCMDSTAYNRDPLCHSARNPLHSMTLHGTHFVQSACFGPCCIKSTAFKHAAWNPLHSIMLHKIHCIQYGSISSRCMESTAFNLASWNPLHSIGMHLTTLHGVHCIQSQ